MPALDVAPIRAAIAAKLASVAGIGNVHNRERFANKASDLIAMYKSGAQVGDRVLGWFVSYARKREFYLDIHRWIADTEWRIGGYMSLDDADASELKLAHLTDKVADAFRDDDALGLGAGYTQIVPERGNQRGLQVEEIDHVLFAGVLCHRVRCSLVVRVHF